MFPFFIALKPHLLRHMLRLAEAFSKMAVENYHCKELAGMIGGNPQDPSLSLDNRPETHSNSHGMFCYFRTFVLFEIIIKKRNLLH